MTVRLDNKRRASFGPSFKPGDSFQREVHGDTVIFRKVEVVPPRMSKVRLEKRGGYTVGALEKPIDEAALQEALADFP